MNTLEQTKPKVKNSRGLNTVEDAIASWYKPPKLKSVLTEELAKQIAECYLDGCTDEDTAILCDVALNTLKNWKNLDCIKKHERERKSFYVHEVRDGKRRDWTRLAWWLERRYPLEFSRPEVAHAISTSIHTVTNVQQNLIVSSELAEQLSERNAKLGAKIDQLFSNRPNNSPSLPVIKGVMTGYIDEPITSSEAHQVKDIASNITELDSVIVDDSSTSEPPNNPPFIAPEAGTPLVAGGPATDTLSRTSDQKTPAPNQKRSRRNKIGLQVPVELTGDSKNLDGSITRKNFDTGLRKAISSGPKKNNQLELEGQVRKYRKNNMLSESEKLESRGAMEAEILRKSRETKLDRAALRAANRAADKVHPRRAHK